MIQVFSARFDLVAKFGDMVRVARREKNLSQRQVAQRIGKSATYINYVESGVNPSSKSGKFQPSAETVERIAKVLNLDLDEALLAAGYAPRTRQLPPTNAAELIEALERLGITIGGTQIGNLADMSAEEFDAFRRDLEKAIGITIAIHRE